MAIPDFDKNGLLPDGEWLCTPEEISSKLCWNSHRASLFSGFENYLNQVWAPLGMSLPIYVDGSFVREKQLPGDIDIVIDATSANNNDIAVLFVEIRLKHDENKKLFNVDAWISHPQLSDMISFFKYLGVKGGADLNLDCNHPKGILRLR